MREIKFRVWDTFNERVVMDPYRFRTNTDDPSEDSRFNAPWQYVEDWQDDDDGVWRPCHVMQFTGLLDKNGKEIWEGDVVEKDGERWQILWDERRAGFRFLSILSTKRKFGGLELRIPESVGCQQYLMEAMIIVGNVYENPELLSPHP